MSQQSMNGTRIIWRLLEIHMVKLVSTTIVIVVTHQVSALNYVFVLLIFLVIPFPKCYRVMSIFIMMYLSLVFIVKMICQLELLSPDDYMMGCNYTRIEEVRLDSIFSTYTPGVVQYLKGNTYLKLPPFRVLQL